MSTKICTNCYQINTVKGSANYCMWCAHDLRNEDTLDSSEVSASEWVETMVTANKIQEIKAKQCIATFDKEAILNDRQLLIKWYLAFKCIENRLN